MNPASRSGPEEEAEGWERITSGRTRPPWFDSSSLLSYEKLGRDTSADVVVIGGGIAGMTTAYLLSKDGKKVAVLEDGNIGSGETGRSTAHITCALDDRYYHIEKIHGKKGAKLAAESHSAAIEMIASIVREEAIKCDFEFLDGYLFLDPTDKQISLERELRSTHDAGLTGTEMMESAPLTSFDTGRCIRFPRQAQFHPVNYVAGLADAIRKMGGRVFTGAHAKGIGHTAVVTSDGRKVRGKAIVVATNSPIVDKVSRIYEKQSAYRTYVIGFKVNLGAVPRALYWDTGNHRSKYPVLPYHYVRTNYSTGSPGNALLIVGGEDHPTGRTNDAERRFQKLESWARRRFPIGDVANRWSGQVFEPKDSLAFIGHNPRDKRNNVFIATGDSGNGITHGTIAGMILRDLILGRRNRWANLYDPSRTVRRPHEDGGGGQQVRRVDLRVALRDARRLSPCQGLVAEVKREDPIAFYKHDDGSLTALSAVCTHVGCTVAWNDLEKSFDCACHGSRFSYDGQVVTSPANENLKRKRNKLAL